MKVNAPDNSATPNLDDLGDYLSGLAKVLLARDQQRQVHEAKLAELKRAERAEEAQREQERQAQREIFERATALEELALLRQRQAHVLDRALAMRQALDAFLAKPAGLDPRCVLKEVRAELAVLPKLFEKLDKLRLAGLPEADMDALLPKGLYDASSALAAVDPILNRVPQTGLGRFVKIDAKGEHLPAFADKWVAVLDTASGLMWEVKTEGGLHSRHSTYTNFSKDEAGDSGRLIRQLNDERFAGHADWRMPTADELVALARSRSVGGAEFMINQCEFCWSSSAAADGGAWYVNLDDGGRSYYSHSYQCAVRVVRAGQ